MAYMMMLDFRHFYFSSFLKIKQLKGQANVKQMGIILETRAKGSQLTGPR